MEVHLLRHAQGAHNLAAYLHGAKIYKDPAFHDAELNEAGIEEATRAGEEIRSKQLAFDLVIVSPMRRTLQTLHCLGLPSQLPKVAIEHCREAFGLFTCDRRSKRSELRAAFPHVDFELIATEDDTWHDPYRRETVGEVLERARAFFQWICQVSHHHGYRRILIVSHGVFLETFTSLMEDRSFHGVFGNAELRRITIPKSKIMEVVQPGGGGGEWAKVEPLQQAVQSGDTLQQQQETTPAKKSGGGGVGIEIEDSGGPSALTLATSSTQRSTPASTQSPPKGI